MLIQEIASKGGDLTDISRLNSVFDQAHELESQTQAPAPSTGPLIALVEAKNALISPERPTTKDAIRDLLNETMNRLEHG